MPRKRERYLVIDTIVLRRSNAPLIVEPRANRVFASRVAILRRIRDGAAKVLISAALLKEYREQIDEPRNEFVQAFFALLDLGAEPNWQKFTGADREDLKRCRYPREDQHVLRTAMRKNSVIVTEEKRLLGVDECTHRCFGVHVMDPAAVAA